MASLDFAPIITRLEAAPLHVECGKVLRITGLIVEATSPGLSLGSRCSIQGPPGSPPVAAEVA